MKEGRKEEEEERKKEGRNHNTGMPEKGKGIGENIPRRERKEEEGEEEVCKEQREIEYNIINRMEWDIMGPGSGPGSGSKILSLKKSPQIWQMP